MQQYKQAAAWIESSHAEKYVDNLVNTKLNVIKHFNCLKGNQLHTTLLS